jgi:hypothetical protein
MVAAPQQRAGILSRRQFFAAVVDDLRPALPPSLGNFRHRSNSMLLKIDYGNERIHFEVWTDGQRNRIEVGLHFEDGPASTAAYLAFFDARIIEIKHRLGAAIELERWTTSWGHLFESIPLPRLDRAFAASVSARLARQITLLQPMVEEAGIPAEGRHPEDSPRRRWRKRARS